MDVKSLVGFVWNKAAEAVSVARNAASTIAEIARPIISSAASTAADLSSRLYSYYIKEEEPAAEALAVEPEAIVEEAVEEFEEPLRPVRVRDEERIDELDETTSHVERGSSYSPPIDRSFNNGESEKRSDGFEPQKHAESFEEKSAGPQKSLCTSNAQPMDIDQASEIKALSRQLLVPSSALQAAADDEHRTFPWHGELSELDTRQFFLARSTPQLTAAPIHGEEIQPRTSREIARKVTASFQSLQSKTKPYYRTLEGETPRFSSLVQNPFAPSLQRSHTQPQNLRAADSQPLIHCAQTRIERPSFTKANVDSDVSLEIQDKSVPDVRAHMQSFQARKPNASLSFASIHLTTVFLENRNAPAPKFFAPQTERSRFDAGKSFSALEQLHEPNPERPTPREENLAAAGIRSLTDQAQKIAEKEATEKLQAQEAARKMTEEQSLQRHTLEEEKGKEQERRKRDAHSKSKEEQEARKEKTARGFCYDFLQKGLSKQPKRLLALD